jgi:hypothetical protein
MAGSPAAVLRVEGRPLASHPAKTLARREEIVNMLLMIDVEIVKTQNSVPSLQ